MTIFMGNHIRNSLKKEQQKGNENASKKRKVQQNNKLQHQEGDASGKTAETSSSNRHEHGGKE